jgi:hypothetical protein
MRLRWFIEKVFIAGSSKLWTPPTDELSWPNSSLLVCGRCLGEGAFERVSYASHLIPLISISTRCKLGIRSSLHPRATMLQTWNHSLKSSYPPNRWSCLASHGVIWVCWGGKLGTVSKYVPNISSRVLLPNAFASRRMWFSASSPYSKVVQLWLHTRLHRNIH